MTTIPPFHARRACGVAVVDNAQALTAIAHPHCAAVIWRRQPTHSFQTWIDGLAPQHLPRTQMVVTPDRVHEALGHVVQTCGTPNCPECDMLTGDVPAMAMIFADAVGAGYVRVLLEVGANHADWTPCAQDTAARLICTYRGARTQFRLGDTPSSRIHTVPTGAPIVMRGGDAPKALTCNLKAHAPAANSTDQTCLRLTLDLVATAQTTPAPRPHTLH